MFNVNEEIDNIIDEINDDFCESAYDEIFEELCYRVECGELSLEDAEIINEAAYDRYVLEGNAYNKYMNKKQDEYHDLHSKARAAYYLGRKHGNRTALKRASELEDKAEEINSGLSRSHYGSDPFNNDRTIPDAYRRKGWKYASYQNSEKEKKQRWMKQHGNKGERPEERLKAGRYLQAQNIINNSKKEKNDTIRKANKEANNTKKHIMYVS